MAAVAFDTFKLIKRLRDAGFNEAQAEAVSGAVQEAAATDLSQLATKDDIRDRATKTDLAEAKGELKADIAAVKGELKADIAAIKGDILKSVMGLLLTVVSLNAALVLGAMFGLAKLLGH